VFDRGEGSPLGDIALGEGVEYKNTRGATFSQITRFHLRRANYVIFRLMTSPAISRPTTHKKAKPSDPNFTIHESSPQLVIVIAIVISLENPILLAL
jgi:hypothetical protein